jgi:hypothetical protein
MMNANELPGTYVLVNPDFHDDPHGRAAQIGMISYAEPVGDDFMVSFRDGDYCLYSSDALQVLQKGHHITANALAARMHLEKDEFKALLQAGFAGRSIDRLDVRHALELAVTYPSIREHALANLSERLGIVYDKNSTDYRPVISR